MDIDATQLSARIKNKAELDNTIVLANIVELASSVLAKLASTTMSGVINNAPVTKSVLATLVAQRAGDLILNQQA